MKTIHSLLDRIPALLFSISISALTMTAVNAQITPEQARMAGAIPLTTQLLDKLDKLSQAIAADAETKMQYVTSGKDSSIAPETAESAIAAKYPKLAAAFKSAGMTVDEFIKTMSTLPMTAALAEMGGTPEEGTAAANIAFYKANKDRVRAALGKLEDLEKGGS